MDRFDISEIRIEEFVLKKAVGYKSDSGKCMLISIDNGTTVCISSELMSQIITGKLSDELKFLLIQRGFASVPGSMEVKDQNCSNRPSFILIDMTNACNLGCRYCFRKPEEEKQFIDESMIDDICDFLSKYITEANLPILTVQPWGGEPLLAAEQIFYLADKIKKMELPIKISIETNGSTITPEIAKKLAYYEISIGVSIDGDEVLHDFHRPFLSGEGSLGRIKESIAYLRQNGYKHIGSISVITKKSINRLRELVSFLIDDMGLDSIKLNIMKQTAYNDHELALSSDEIDQFECEIMDIMTEYYNKGKVVIESNICTKMANLLYRNGDNICLSKGCSGGRELISINRRGEIYPCEMTDFPEERISSIYDKTLLSECIENACSSNAYFKRKRKKECETCAWWYFCRGGCSSAVKYGSGSITGVDENECRLNRSLYPRLVEMILCSPDLAESIARGQVVAGEEAVL